MTALTPVEILALPMGDNGAGAATIRGYLVALLQRVWQGHDATRPWGTPGWQWELYGVLVDAGVVNGSRDEDGTPDCVVRDADRIIDAAIVALGSTSPDQAHRPGTWYPGMPDETPAEYTDRLTGADRTGRVPYDHRRRRQCSIGYHDECSDPCGEDCQCPCHTTPPGQPRHDDLRPFLLVRDEDVTGVSGTGVVAQGVEFADGTVALQWLSEWPVPMLHHDRGVESVQHVHGHDERTRIVWLSTPDGVESHG